MPIKPTDQDQNTDTVKKSQPDAPGGQKDNSKQSPSDARDVHGKYGQGRSTIDTDGEVTDAYEYKEGGLPDTSKYAVDKKDSGRRQPERRDGSARDAV